MYSVKSVHFPSFYFKNIFYLFPSFLFSIISSFIV